MSARRLAQSLAWVAAILVVLVGVRPAAAITGGTPDGAAHPFVGMVYNDDYFCSGALIAPTVFLTAAHCTTLFAAGASSVYVTFAAKADFDPDHAVLATAVESHPQFCNPCGSGLPGFDAYDVGVVLLAKPVANVGVGTLPAGERSTTWARGRR